MKPDSLGLMVAALLVSVMLLVVVFGFLNMFGAL